MALLPYLGLPLSSPLLVCLVCVLLLPSYLAGPIAAARDPAQATGEDSSAVEQRDSSARHRALVDTAASLHHRLGISGYGTEEQRDPSAELLAGTPYRTIGIPIPGSIARGCARRRPPRSSSNPHDSDWIGFWFQLPCTPRAQALAPAANRNRPTAALPAPGGPQV